MLGNVEMLPDDDSIEVYKRMNKNLQLVHQSHKGADLKTELHKLAHQLLEKKEIQDAWKVLLS